MEIAQELHSIVNVINNLTYSECHCERSPAPHGVQSEVKVDTTHVPRIKCGVLAMTTFLGCTLKTKLPGNVKSFKITGLVPDWAWATTSQNILSGYTCEIAGLPADRKKIAREV